jgi:hypothetical protein
MEIVDSIIAFFTAILNAIVGFFQWLFSGFTSKNEAEVL